ncbi:hypothetical protein Psta_3478 [Pirellula staleyi DSM 6068]|uniref:Uncharacterized protein n=1 Tax=Pirellula staleyi (strain ATCC 27377 / DSM 6068 / ICPB 4128) TaxID=530564 RepID=D2QYI1_PIRSD|nr:hypothetical protein Psta_3478 [Pirellula staleyi DSM 6068]
MTGNFEIGVVRSAAKISAGYRRRQHTALQPHEYRDSAANGSHHGKVVANCRNQQLRGHKPPQVGEGQSFG